MTEQPNNPDQPTPQKRGPKPYQAPTDRPYLAAEWEDLRQWWTQYGKRYSLPELAIEIGLAEDTLWRLLRGIGRSAPTAERLDMIVKALAFHYVPAKQRNK